MADNLAPVTSSELHNDAALSSSAKLQTKELLRSLYALTKPTITLLVMVTTVPGVLIAGDQIPSWSVWFAVIGGTCLSSASAAVFNQVIDAQIDRKMMRTNKRPLPLGRLSETAAISYGFALGIVGTAWLCAKTNPLAAGIALSANLFYVLVYTLVLKRMTSQNIVIGGAAGAVGPLIGCAAVSGGINSAAWAMFSLIFLWTPPHFWALALKYMDDYARAGIPMLPVVKGVDHTKRQIFYYSLTLFLPMVWLAYVDMLSGVGLTVCLAMTGYFVYQAFLLLRTEGIKRCMPVFVVSCFYLLAVFGIFGVDRLLTIYFRS